MGVVRRRRCGLVDDEKADAKTRNWVGNRYGRWNTAVGIERKRDAKSGWTRWRNNHGE